MQYIQHCRDADREKVEHKFLDYEERRRRIFRAINIKKNDFSTAYADINPLPPLS